MKVDAYDANTGKKLPHQVPEAWLALFPNIRLTPLARARKASKAATKADTAETPQKEN